MIALASLAGGGAAIAIASIEIGIAIVGVGSFVAMGWLVFANAPPSSGKGGDPGAINFGK